MQYIDPRQVVPLPVFNKRKPGEQGATDLREAADNDQPAVAASTPEHVEPPPWHAPMALAETPAVSRPSVEPPGYSSPMYARMDPEMASRRVELPPAVEPIGTASPERVPMPEMATRPVQPTGPNYTPPPAERTPGKGWKGRLASIGKGLLYGASIGAEGGGGAGAIGGALAGALGGGISPSAVARYQHERIDMPKWEHTHAREEADNQREVQQQNIAADNERANQDLALRTRGQGLNEAYRRDQLSENTANRDEREKQRQSERAEARAAAAIARSQSTGEPVDPLEVKGTTQERWGGKKVPRAEKPISALDQARLDQGERRIGIQQSENELRRNEHRSDREQKQYDRSLTKHTARINTATAEMERAQKALDKAREDDKQEEGTGDWTGAAAAVNRVMAKYPDLVDGVATAPKYDPKTNQFTNYPAINWKGGNVPNPEELAGKEVPTSGGAGQQGADHTGYAVGQTVEHNGKKYTYKGINPKTGKMRLVPAE